jgi:hypothetical protein
LKQWMSAFISGSRIAMTLSETGGGIIVLSASLVDFIICACEDAILGAFETFGLGLGAINVGGVGLRVIPYHLQLVCTRNGSLTLP